MLLMADEEKEWLSKQYFKNTVNDAYTGGKGGCCSCV